MASPAIELNACEHASAMGKYQQGGEQRAAELGNRGPIRFDAQGDIHPDILDAYWRCGFYVFEGVIGEVEIDELRADVERVLHGAPAQPEAVLDKDGNSAIGSAYDRPSFSFAAPLSDPVGGTNKNKGRHPVKMLEPLPAADAPAFTIERIRGNLQLMDSCLRLYGHHGLLSIAAAVNGPDFVPYNEVTFVKEAGLGVSVAWHRDGTTHWDAADWDQGAHGFNFMAQLYSSTAANGVWVLPGTHKVKHMDIAQLVAQSGSERIADAVPMLCAPGDVVISNRQLVHGSFANTSCERRITLNMGFFPRRRVENVTTTRLDGVAETYDAQRLARRTRLIAVAIDARRQRFADEPRYVYAPLLGREDENRWNEATRKAVVDNYSVYDMYI
ncbi:MAG: hypothetical protein ACI8W7_003336 [Gammaproteobacteria bacterium]|jgi:hypothetical protein